MTLPYVRIAHAAFLVTMLSAPYVFGLAQQQDGAPPQSPASAPAQHAAPDQAVKPSGLLQPALDALEQTAGAIKVEKWKGGSIRAEASTNIASIIRDLQSTLPPLLKDADAAPGSMSKLLPVSRNVDALYDVLLRVVDGASVAAPADQLTQLQQAMAGLNKARHTLDDRVQDLATAREKQVNDLQAALKAQAQAVPVCPTPAPPPAPPAKKPAPKKKKPKPPNTPSSTPSTTPPAGAAKPAGTAKPSQ